jgi:hypothetical protein
VVATLPRRGRRQRRSNSYRTSVTERALRVTGVAIGILSLSGILLTCLGFGFALALSAFGLDVLEVFGGPADYLSTSSLAVVTGFNQLVIEDGSPAAIAGRLVWAFVIGITVVVFGVAGASAFVHRRRLSTMAQRAEQRMRGWGSVAAQRPWYWRVPVVLVAGLLSGGAVFVALRVLMSVAAMLLIVFVVGFKLGHQHFYETVIEPERCASNSNLAQRRMSADRARQTEPKGETLRPYLAACIEVVSKDHGSQRGRRVIATRDVVVLFDPKTGAVSAVPKAGAIVKSVDRLDD